MSNIRIKIVFFMIVCCLIVMNGRVVSAQSVGDNKGSSESTSLSDMQGDEGSFLASDTGLVEMIDQTELQIWGMEYGFNGEEVCTDMNDDPIELESLKNGDEVAIDYRVSDKIVVAIRLLKKGDRSDAFDSDDEPVRKDVNSRKIRRQKDGTYTN